MTRAVRFVCRSGFVFLFLTTSNVATAQTEPVMPVGFQREIFSVTYTRPRRVDCMDTGLVAFNRKAITIDGDLNDDTLAVYLNDGLIYKQRVRDAKVAVPNVKPGENNVVTISLLRQRGYIRFGWDVRYKYALVERWRDHGKGNWSVVFSNVATRDD